MDENISNALEDLPAGTIVFKADYDAEEELKKKYGVISQDTLVFLNADGSVHKLAMGGTLDHISEFFSS